MSEELEIAINACKEAGSVLLKHFNTPLQFSEKADKSIVSEADKAAENIILGILGEKFPDYSYYSEEAGFSSHTSRKMWVIDPLDGTNNFAIGVPNFGISIALIKNNKLVLGVIYQPFLDKMAYAEKGKGAFMNGNLIEKADTPADSSQIISIVAGYPNQHLQKQMMFELNDKVKRILTHWAPSIDFMMLAEGKIDSIISLESETEDQLAGILIAEESGCSVKMIEGNDFKLEQFSEFLPRLVISRSEKHHAELLRLMR